MAIPQMKRSFCGVSLQMGCKLIAIFHLATAIAFLVMSILELAKGRFISIPGEDITLENPHFNYAIATAVGLLIGIFFAVLLFYGASTLSPAKVLPWAIFVIVGATISLVGTLYISITLLVGGVTGPGLTNLFGGFAILAVQGYLVLVVYSFYRELKDKPLNTVNYAAAPQRDQFQPQYYR